MRVLGSGYRSMRRQLGGEAATDVRRAGAIAVAGCLAMTSACTGSSHARPAAGPSSRPPTTAPSRVLPVKAVLPRIEAFVEHERGLRFKHPVGVRLLGTKAFVAKLQKIQGKPKKLDIEKTTSVLAALGLVSPTVDLAKAFRTAYDAGTLGFYSNKSKKLYVKGTRATPGVRAVLSHELTHALTDQWFGLRRPKLNKGNQELGLAFTALIEGDAERTRKAYEATLSPADQQLATKEENAGGTPPHVPQIVLVFIGFPYAVGPTFVDAVVAHGGTKALNAAYRDPPRSSEQLLVPTTYFAHDNPKHVDVPHADGPTLDHGDLGLVGLLLMLEHGMDRTSAQQAVVGWGGDQYVVWRAGNHRWCLRDTVVMDDQEATFRLDSGLSQWAATTNGRAHIEQQGARTTFRSCSS